MRLIMPVILFLAFVPNTFAANKTPPFMPNGTTRATKNTHGGYNYYSGSRYLGRSTSNSFGGQNYYSPRGYIGRTTQPMPGTFRFSK